MTTPLTCSVPEAGQLLGIGKASAYAAAARGEIPTLRLGRSLRVPMPKLLALVGALEAGVAGPDSPATANTEPVKGAQDDGTSRALWSA